QVVENGVELAPFANLTPPDLVSHGPRPRRVGMVANLRPVKDPQLFVRAAQLVAESHPDVEFCIAGEGEMHAALQNAIDGIGLRQRVRLLGKVRDVPAFLSSVELAVLCSRSEGCSNALLEYMAAGRAIVATAVGGTVQLIQDGVHGL